MELCRRNCVVAISFSTPTKMIILSEWLNSKSISKHYKYIAIQNVVNNPLYSWRIKWTKKILPTESPNLWDEFCTKDFWWIFTLSPNIFPDKWYQPLISVNCLLTQIKQKYASRRGRLPVVLVCQCLYSIYLSWSDNWRIITSYNPAIHQISISGISTSKNGRPI